jgi:hypothetical protein
VLVWSPCGLGISPTEATGVETLRGGFTHSPIVAALIAEESDARLRDREEIAEDSVTRTSLLADEIRHGDLDPPGPADRIADEA